MEARPGGMSRGRAVRLRGLETWTEEKAYIQGF